MDREQLKQPFWPVLKMPGPLRRLRFPQMEPSTKAATDAMTNSSEAHLRHAYRQSSTQLIVAKAKTETLHRIRKVVVTFELDLRLGAHIALRPS